MNSKPHYVYPVLTETLSNIQTSMGGFPREEEISPDIPIGHNPTGQPPGQCPSQPRTFPVTAKVWYGIVGFNVPLGSRHIIGHFGYEAVKAKN